MKQHLRGGLFFWLGVYGCLSGIVLTIRFLVEMNKSLFAIIFKIYDLQNRAFRGGG